VENEIIFGVFARENRYFTPARGEVAAAPVAAAPLVVAEGEGLDPSTFLGFWAALTAEAPVVEATGVPAAGALVVLAEAFSVSFFEAEDFFLILAASDKPT
jgi:hypothetical protein